MAAPQPETENISEQEVIRIICKIQQPTVDSADWKNLFNDVDQQIFFEKRTATFYQSAIYLAYFVRYEKYKDPNLPTTEFGTKVTQKEFSKLMGVGYGLSNLNDIAAAGRLFFHLI